MADTRGVVLVLGLLVGAGAFVYAGKVGILGDGDTVPISRLCMGGGANEGVYWRAIDPLQTAPARGDRVVVEGLTINALEARVLGLPGDTVQVSDGHVSIDGRPIDRTPTKHSSATWPSYIERVGDHAYKTSWSDPDPVPHTVALVPDGHVFVLGDHRWASSTCDPALGVVPLTRIVGLAPWTD